MISRVFRITVAILAVGTVAAQTNRIPVDSSTALRWEASSGPEADAFLLGCFEPGASVAIKEIRLATNMVRIADIGLAEPGDYDLRVMALVEDGRRSEWSAVFPITWLGEAGASERQEGSASRDRDAVKEGAARTLQVARPGGFTNGSFEEGYTGWTITGAHRIIDALSSEGKHALLMNQGQAPASAVATQTFGTEPGRRYRIEFDFGALSHSNKEAQKMHVAVLGSAILLTNTVSLNASGQGVQYRPFTFEFVADNPLTTITFRDVSETTANVDALLDNIRITVIP